MTFLPEFIYFLTLWRMRRGRKAAGDLGGNDTYLLRLKLEGMACAACEMAVNGAIRSFGKHEVDGISTVQELSTVHSEVVLEKGDGMAILRITPPDLSDDVVGRIK